MARASYIAQAARRAADDAVPALMPPSALLVRWQMAAPLLEAEPPVAPEDRAQSAPSEADRPEPIAARPTASGDRGVPAVAAFTTRPGVSPRTTVGGIVRLTSGAQADSHSSGRAAPAPAKAIALTETSTSGAATTPISPSAQPRSAAARSAQAEQSAGHPSPMTASAYAPLARIEAQIKKAAVPSHLGAVAQGSAEVSESRAAPMPIVLAPPAAAPTHTQATPPATRAVLTPSAPPEHAPVVHPPRAGEQPPAPSIIRIGSVEIQIAPVTAPPTPAARPAAAVQPRSSLSRDLISMYGLRQG